MKSYLRLDQQAYGRLLVFVCLLFTSLAPLAPSVSAAVNPHATYKVSGTVFRDYNENGSQDTREPGVPNVTVTAYDSSGAVAGTATTTSSTKAILGTYSITGLTVPVSIRFTGLPAGFYPAAHAASTGITATNTNVTVVDGSGGTGTDQVVNYGINFPGEYCQSNPQLATACYFGGARTDAGVANTGTIKSFADNASGDTPTVTNLSTVTQVGATYGIAYQSSSASVFVSAFEKRHVDIGPNGTGAIYKITGGTTTSFATIPSTGTDAHPISGNADFPKFFHDASTYTQIGKIGLGGMKIVNDKVIYVVNLADKKLYEVNIDAPGSNHAYSLPAITCNGNVRPFGLGTYLNAIYEGVVCDGPAQTDLKAYVFKFNPSLAASGDATLGSGSFATTAVLIFSLNDTDATHPYQRGCTVDTNATAGSCKNLTASTASRAASYWQPWNDTFPSGSFTYYTNNASLAQPMIGSISFDNGDMLIGMRDRFGDQTGNAEGDTSTNGSGTYSGDSAGDVLRATNNDFVNNNSWTLESNATAQVTNKIAASVTITASTNNGQGPDGGSFYYQQGWHLVSNDTHDYTTMGGLTQIPGSNRVAVTGFDPNDVFRSGGVRWYATDGTANQETQLYGTDQGGTGVVGATGGKANGLGDLVTLCNVAPLEIGNRVWLDLNKNGVQDGGEAGLAGVHVSLYSGSTLLATAITDANGEYYFTSDTTVTPTASLVYVALTAGTSYTVKLNTASDYALNGTLYQLKATGKGIAAGAGIADSKGNAVTTSDTDSDPITLTSVGQDNHNIDFGFYNNSPSGVTNLQASTTHINLSTSAASQNLNLTASQDTNYTSTINYTNPNATGWLSVSNASGSILAGNTKTLALAANTAGMANGTYTAQLLIQDTANAANSVAISVSLTIGTTYNYYLPYLANGAGGFTSFVSIQNIGASPASVQTQYFDRNGSAIGVMAATCNNVASNAQCAPANPFSSTATGTGVLISNQPLSVIVAENTPFGASAYVVAAGASASLVAPLAINNSGGFSTQLTIFNTAATDSNVMVNFFDQSGAQLTAATKNVTIAAHSSQSFDQTAPDSNLPAGFYGWAKIDGATGSQLVAQVLEQNQAAHFVALANAQSQAQSSLFAPAIYKGAFGSFVTGANIVNPNSSPVEVTVTYYQQDGTALSAVPFTIAAHGVQPVFQGATSGNGLPNGGLPNGFVGAANITSASGGVVVAVNQAGGLTEGGTARSGTYLAGSSGSSTLGLPIVANHSNGYTSGATILNSSNASVGGTIHYYNPTGQEVGSQTFSIAAHASYLAYQGGGQLAAGYIGQATVVQTSGPANSLFATTNVQSANLFYSYAEPTL